MPKVIDHTKIWQASKNPRQWEASQAPERYLLYGGAKGGGKTAWLINKGIWLSMKFPGNRGFLGCKYSTDFKANALLQLEKFLPPEIIMSGGHHKVEQKFYLTNGSTIAYGGLGNDAEAVQTINNMPELGWFGIDQAEQITERQYLLLDAQLRLAIPGIIYKALLTANPEPGWLRDRFIENPKPGYRFIPALPKDNPFLPSDYEENLRKSLPADLVKRLMEGDWDVETEGNYLIPYPQIRAAINKELEPTGEIIAGVDPSWEGGAETVFTLRQGGKATLIDSWSHADSLLNAGRIARLIREHRPVVSNVDHIGYGVGTFDTLRGEGFAVRGINVGEAALDSENYANRRAEYYFLLAKRFERGEIDIPDHPKLQSQLASLKYYPDTKGRLIMESKKQMQARGMSSPDYADSLMLAFIDSQSGPVTSVSTLDFPVRSYR